ncbi:MAG: peptidoglycan-binding protein, partial [Kiritimatiellia bacterium]
MRLACSRYALIAALLLCVGTALGSTVKPNRQTPIPSQATPPITAAAAAQGFPLHQPRWIDVLLLQVWLDRHNFSCGSIDGVFGTKSVAAWKAWQKASAGEQFPLEELAADWLLTSHTVSQEDYAALVDIPPEWEARAKLPTMGFESIAELVAEDYHLSPKALVRLNPTATFPNPPVGTVLVVPNTKDVALEPAARLEIDLDRFTLSAYGATGRQIAHFPVSIA